MADLQLEITGLAEVQRALYSYSNQLGDKVIYAGLRVGANIVKKATQAGAPVRTGALRRGFVVKRSKIYTARKSSQLGLFLTIRKGQGRKDPRDAFYGRWVNDGWRAHGRNKRGSQPKTLGRGKTQVPGKQFVQRGLLSTRVVATQAMVKYIQVAADVIARKQGLK